MITIHVVTYQTPDGTEWQYRTATLTETARSTDEIRETADRQAAETDPALTFVRHDVTQPGTEEEPAPEEPSA